MKVRKTALLLVLATLSLPSIAAQPGKCGSGYDRWDLNCDGKIDGEEAYASMKPFEDHHRAVSRPANRKGLPPPSEAGYPLRAPESADQGKIGKWRRIDARPVRHPDLVLIRSGSTYRPPKWVFRNNKPEYTKTILQSEEGTACIVGEKAVAHPFVAACLTYDKNGHCQYRSKTHKTFSDNLYKQRVYRFVCEK